MIFDPDDICGRVLGMALWAFVLAFNVRMRLLATLFAVECIASLALYQSFSLCRGACKSDLLLFTFFVGALHQSDLKFWT